MNFENEHLTRQRDVIPTEKLTENVTIVGAGAIGSWVALSLAKMGMTNITVYDFDKVDTVNMNSQFYRFKDIGGPKVFALQDLINDFTGVTINAINQKYDGSAKSGILITAVDSMEVRSSIWKQHKNNTPYLKFIIDPRMSAENALLYVMNPMKELDIDDYEKTLYTDEQAMEERCTAKATIYTANLLSGLVCKAVKDVISNGKMARISMWDIKNNELVQFAGI